MIKKDIIVFGSLNMDLVVNTTKFPNLGETIVCDKFYTAPGGKGGNQAVAAARLASQEYKVKFIGRVGEDIFGQEILKNLKSENIDTSFVKITKNISTGIASIFIMPSGENSVNAVYGANYEIDKSQINDFEKISDNAGVLLLQQEIPDTTLKLILKTAHKKQIPVILDPAPYKENVIEFYKNINIITPNEIEASSISNTEVKDIPSAKKAARFIRNLGCDNVIITLGAKGIWIEGENISEHVKSFKVKAKSSVGAGDAFNGALGYGIVKNNNLLDSIELAIATSSMSVTREGAQNSMPLIGEVIEFINS
ncbi:MAG: ribokinase [Dehalococcoidia bacterium]|nr:ribokinase [Dehalococcoidia bacterium]MQG09533.1 ribokinase [SAR202 cluster bacterium]|tara:strand:+ start:34450 stop:35379 length:930 start_codon:yes stop_codon:yes gene_type:complete